MSCLRVLVADDHPVCRTLLTHLFSAFDCSVTAVADAHEAMALAQAYDVICLDRNMPGLDGPSAARGLRGQAFLVACTSQQEGLEDQFEAVLAKPVSCGAVADVVALALTWLGNRAAAASVIPSPACDAA